MRLDHAIVLCGGAGTRLRSVLSDRPKSLAIVGGRPFLEWLVLLLVEQGIRRLTLAIGYRGEQIERHFTDSSFGLHVSFSREAEPLGTGGALRLAACAEDSQHVLVLNGDSYCRFEAERMATKLTSAHASAVLWLAHPADSGDRYGSVDVRGDGRIVGFHEKEPGQVRLSNAGVYLLDRGFVESIPAHLPVSLERQVFPAALNQALYGVVGDSPFVDIGTPESLAAAEAILAPEFERLEAIR